MYVGPQNYRRKRAKKMLALLLCATALTHPLGAAVSRRAALVSIPALALPAVGVLPALAEGQVKTSSGLVYEDIVVGSGARPISGQTVSVMYTGWLDDFDSEKIFDSSYERRRPITFAVGTGRVIKGWDEALLSMQVGGKRRVIIPPALGYGSKGAGYIPPDTTIYFEMELKAIQ